MPIFTTNLIFATDFNKNIGIRQIELIFKGFKSGMNFDCVGNVGKDYFECLIYGRLIIATAVSWMFSMYSFLMYLECGELLSKF